MKSGEIQSSVSARSPRGFLLLERALLSIVLAIGMLTTAGCSTTQFYEREKLNDRAAQFDQDGGLNYLRQKIEAAREGSLGGFGSAEAGGCGCQ